MAEKNETRQLVVIGAGPGGYAAAFHAADLGLKVTLIDRESNPGGVCLHRGCIPTKALLHASQIAADAQHAKSMGIEFGTPKINADQLRGWKNEVVKKLTQGLGYLCKKRKVEYIQGQAKFTGSQTLEAAQKEGGTESISFEHAILATGAVPARLPNLPYDNPGILDSTSALDPDRIPESMLVIGGGYIGLELGSVYARLGSKVTVVEMLPGLMPASDRELIAVAEKQLRNLFEAILLKTKVADVKASDNGFQVWFEGEDLKQKEGTFEKILVSVGRKPNTADIGLDNTRVQMDEKGFISIDRQCRTDDPSIFAIGDVTGAPQLAHRATHQGMTAAKVIAGLDAVFEPRAIPFVEYIDPEIAECGLSEEMAKQSGIPFKVSKFPWSASGRAATLGKGEGLTKLILDEETERVLGVGIVGAGAGELIAEGALAVEMAATAADLAMTIHPHPTLSETLMEAAEMYIGRSVNF